MTRAAAIAAHERRAVSVLELDVDTCSRTYGVAPCTAAGLPGSECYNTVNTCQDRSNYLATTQTIKFVSRGVAPPPGETMRPYLEKAELVATEIDPEKGLAARGQAQITLADEPCRDDLDPYIANRAIEAGGTFWRRFMARNPAAIGRTARIRRGFVVSPWDWSTFVSETYVINAITGPGRDGAVDLTLADATRLLDRAKIPAVTDGKLLADFAAYLHVGTATGGTATTILLGPTASALDDAYNGSEIYLTGNVGSGQRRTITDYVGASREATVSAWSVTPDTTTTYEVSPLSLTLQDGQGAQYPDPATSGKPEFIRVKDEVIRIRAKSGDTLSWTSSDDREQFGTVRPYPGEERDDGTKQSAKAGDLVQLCRAWIDEAPADVITDLCTEGGLSAGEIDTAGLAAICTDWLALNSNLTACITTPEQSSTLLGEILRDLGLMVWWDAVAGKVTFKADRPQADDTVAARTDDAWIDGSLDHDRLDDSRITQSAMLFDLSSATADKGKVESYLAAVVAVDTDAESAAEYGDSRPEVRKSRWLTRSNTVPAKASARRRLLALRDAPGVYTARLDPRDEVAIGDLVDVTCRQVTNVAGVPVPVRCRVVRVRDRGKFHEVKLRSTRYNAGYIDASGVSRNLRAAFIAPAGQPNYTSATAAQQGYAYICAAADSMSNGDDPYLIL